ncbi:protein starmaker isoform X2 [Betta splendens]|uniref:Protein starmaker isoform X2 n=1 Tax=Betta splendens TaxID=158456 RepID=A0A9W2XGG1_BETSP|nr:protein starmaker isoform X2 [Betta splendens]
MTRLYFVLCLVCSCSVSGQSLTYGLMGLKVTLKPDVTGTKQPDEILWKHNGNKVVEFDGRKQQEFSLFENRVTLDWISAELSITGLRLDDSGEYDLEVYANKVLKRQTLNLEVLEKLAKPNITCETSNDGEEATLTCSVESTQPQNLMYEWIYHGPGQWLTVPLSDKSTEYTCIVRNRLSNATATVTAKTCYPDEGVSTLIISLIGAAVLLGAVIAVVVGIICCKRYNKGLNNETPHNDEESHLVHRTPTVPSSQRLGGSVRQQVQEFEKNPHIRSLFSGTATVASPRKSSSEGANSSNKGEADSEPLDPSHSDQEAEPGLNNEAPQNKQSNAPSEDAASSAQQPISPSHDDTNMTSTCGEPDNKNDHTDKVDGQSQMPPEGLNNEAPQNKHIKPPGEPAASSAQQPVNLSHDDTNMTSTCDEPDNKNGHTDKVDGQSQMPPEGNVQEVVSNFENIPNNRTDTKQSFCAETKQLDALHPEQGTEAGLNNEAPQNKHSNPPSEPATSSAQQPVSPSHGDINMKSTCDEPDNKNIPNGKVDGQSQMPPEDQQKQLCKDGGEEPPAKETVRPPVPRPRLSKRFPAVGTKDTTEHNEGADSDQVTDKTKEENVKLSECEKNNDPNKKSQIGKAVSDQTESDNNQCQSPPIPEKPDQSNSLQESPDATHSDLDQQTQYKVECDSPKCEEQSDNNTTVSKENNGKEEGDTDDNEGQCSGKEKQPDKESDDEDTRLEESDEDGDDEDTEQKMLLK